MLRHALLPTSRSLAHRVRRFLPLGALVVASACQEPTTSVPSTHATSGLHPSTPSLDLAAARADSLAKGYFGPRVSGFMQSSSGVSVVSVTPSWFQGAAQPNLIFAQLAGPVKTFTVRGGTVPGDAIMCSGDYGRLRAYDVLFQLIADVPLTLIDPTDCGSDAVTFGAQATITSSSAEIANIIIVPMSPLNFPVLGFPGGKASATYVPQLIADPDPNQPPVAVPSVACFVSTRVCTFDGSQSTDDGGIVSYKWDAGAGIAGKLTGKIVSFTYPNANTRVITLTVTDANGRSGTAHQPFYFDYITQPGSNYPPSPAFVATCTNLTCTFDSSASTDDVGIVGRGWNFGDGTGSSGYDNIVRHTYASPGAYDVVLSAYDGGGAGTQSANIVRVGLPPVDNPPTASFVQTCTGQSYPHQCAFDASGSTDDNGIVSYKWDWGNGRTETHTGSTVRNTWASSGQYPVTLTVTDAAAQTAQYAVMLFVP